MQVGTPLDVCCALLCVQATQISQYVPKGRPPYIGVSMPKALFLSQLPDTPLPTTLTWVVKDLALPGDHGYGLNQSQAGRNMLQMGSPWIWIKSLFEIPVILERSVSLHKPGDPSWSQHGTDGVPMAAMLVMCCVHSSLAAA
jgi:hypothetical protein